MPLRANPLCPSAPHDAIGAQVFAVVGGTPQSPDTAYLDDTQPVTDELVAMTAPVTPTEVFRIAAPCLGGRCGHFDGEKNSCRLVAKTVRFKPAVVERLPRCAIRSACRWWQQEGLSACLRCPQVVTKNFSPSAAARAAADVNNIP